MQELEHREQGLMLDLVLGQELDLEWGLELDLTLELLSLIFGCRAQPWA